MLESTRGLKEHWKSIRFRTRGIQEECWESVGGVLEERYRITRGISEERSRSMGRVLRRCLGRSQRSISRVLKEQFESAGRIKRVLEKS